ncbi:MAG TPA: asparagine--tRNA ligase [Candidatus Acidoferrales bacterium]|nr:asparagine--tRNA ligase [Candidatus Acidoferrales bacterium]
MPEFTIARAADFEGQQVTLRGWLYNLRESGKLLFPIFRDGTGLMQAVVSKADVSPEIWERVGSLTQESSVIARGSVRRDPRAPGGYELVLRDLEIVQAVPLDEPYPISLKEHGVDFLMDRRHLWVRSPRQAALLRLRHEAMRSAREFLDNQGFVETSAPILTPAACEGTSTLFELDYFDLGQAYLTQSGQLYIEGTAAALGKVYCFGPTFRAEKSKTRRHLTEFWMLEPEVAFATLPDLMKLGEELVSAIVEKVLERRRADLETLGRDLSKLEKIKPPFYRLSYDEALEVVHKKGSQLPWGEDLGGADETLLSEAFDKPVIVHRYPAKAKAFYMEPDPERPELALCMDMIAPEGYGEIIGGSQRISSLELLRQRIKEHNLPEEAFQWYIDLRKYGSVPHGGFGLGIERTVAWIAGIQHIRETIPYPRMLYRIYP